MPHVPNLIRDVEFEHVTLAKHVPLLDKIYQSLPPENPCRQELAELICSIKLSGSQIESLKLTESKKSEVIEENAILGGDLAKPKTVPELEMKSKVCKALGLDPADVSLNIIKPEEFADVLKDQGFGSGVDLSKTFPQIWCYVEYTDEGNSLSFKLVENEEQYNQVNAQDCAENIEAYVFTADDFPSEAYQDFTAFTEAPITPSVIRRLWYCMSHWTSFDDDNERKRYIYYGVGDIGRPYYEHAVESDIYSEYRDEWTRLAKLLHYALGMSSEGKELVDCIGTLIDAFNDIDKPSAKEYGEVLTKVMTNLVEEVGDLMYYYMRIKSLLKFDSMNVAFSNAVKLIKRYPNKFSREATLNRDINRELSHITDVSAEKKQG